MSNVFSMERPQSYWIARAEKHRLSGRYDEAMTLLTRAKQQFGTSEAVEMELARTYEAMACDEEAARAYLRVMRMNGKHRAQALFHLAVASVKRADLRRATSYFELFQTTDGAQVPPQLAKMLGRHLREEAGRANARTRRARAQALERRAVEKMQDGRFHAARRTLRHAMAMHGTAQRLTLLACCCMMSGRVDDAIRAARAAHEKAPARMHTLCVMIDALYLAGEEAQAKRTLYLAALRAHSPDELVSVAIESAKHGHDLLTLRLTRSALNREPFNTRAMTMRACALTNLGRLREASRLFGRLCGLLPEDTVCRAYYRMTREGKAPEERLNLGLDVPRAEAVARAVRLVQTLYGDMERLKGDEVEQRELFGLGAWALRSRLAGDNAALVALLMLSRLDTPGARAVLFDALTDPQVRDHIKFSIMQALTERMGVRRYNVDMDGQLICLAAGGGVEGHSDVPGRDAQARQVVQKAADALMEKYPSSPKKLLTLYIRYIQAYGVPRAGERNACAAALEAAYLALVDAKPNLRRIARRSAASPRLSRMIFSRIMKTELKARKKAEESREGSGPSPEEDGGERGPLAQNDAQREDE